MTSNDIKKLLATKHSNDVIIFECKDGPTGIGMVQMDAWVMKKAWSKPLVTGYEIKVNRSDFLNDKKWVSYLPMCNEFYFVCPGKHIIAVEEVPEDSGLLYVSSTGNVLFTKKKAKFRNVQIPENVFRYILMCRVVVKSREIDCSYLSAREFWKNWLVEKQQDLDLGRLVGERIQEVIREKIERIDEENKSLMKRMDEYEDIKSFIKRLGQNPENVNSWQLERKVQELVELVPKNLERSLERLKRDLSSFEEEIKKIKR